MIDLKHLIRKFPSLKREVGEVVESLELNLQGRIAIKSKGKGKSGGGRIITCVRVKNEFVYLITIYDKSEKDSILLNELDELLNEAGLI